MSENGPCGLSRIMFQYYKEDWKCVPYDISESGNCELCTHKSRELAKKRHDESARQISIAPYVQGDPSPIVSGAYEVSSSKSQHLKNGFHDQM